jgi:peptidoglycan/xylan/chitin deacetylase (PgdA/CDA1 family)
MTGTFIISIDCEGKWGMADHMGPQYDYITEESLDRVYRMIVDAFAHFGIKATFAFVGAFTLSAEERVAHENLFVDVQYKGSNWLSDFRRAASSGSLDGWFCPNGFAMAKAGGHEIACHGFSHIPFDDPNISQQTMEADVEAALKVAAEKGVRFDTFVFPRNRVGHTNILKAQNFVAYRGAMPTTSRFASLAGEANIYQCSQPHGTPHNGLLEIPTGYFLNWRRGIRACIPKRISRMRWASILDNAVRNDELAHLYFHPHNLINGPESFDLLVDVLRAVCERRDAGSIIVETQAEYAHSRLQL